ncbi:helix-turn-helix transcriptional regulator [Streptomyces sp. NPDC021356]|uniref:helix-turn-helix domain-containing protein n=1 Tax=Streptomyces sp. NPDC021356 TaxID=3154900 RepID=UPI0033DDBAF4
MDQGTFGRLLREARQRSLLTLESVAQASGVSVRAISDMERGRSLPRQATLGELLDALEPGEDERRRLVHAAARRTRRAPEQLPPDLTDFRGRGEALAAVHGLTARVAGRGGHVVISAIGGMAGVGKTAPAVHWAHQVADRFPDGRLYVNAASRSPGASVSPTRSRGHSPSSAASSPSAVTRRKPSSPARR